MKNYLIFVIAILCFYITSCSHMLPLHTAARTGDLKEKKSATY